jgi:heparosan-N-sulfate-glucuronate 5-epimerase
MTALRRLALAFPSSWSHRRPYLYDGRQQAGRGRYYVRWDGGSAVYGEDWIGAPHDDKGVLLTGRDRHYHPIRIAQCALQRYTLWCEGRDLQDGEVFLAQARWLRDNQRERESIGGLYLFDFPWNKYGASTGWRSAMAQGEAISVLLRAQNIAPRCGFGDAALRAALPFAHEISEGGVTYRRGRDRFFEEIANEHAPHVLNGCIFALWGLWELHAVSHNAAVASWIEECVETLVRWLPRFDTGWWSLYSLMHTGNGHPHIATLKYHAFHIAQLRVLALMFDMPVFEHTADRWDSYVDARRSRLRVYVSSGLSVLDRAFRRDTVAGGAHT